MPCKDQNLAKQVENYLKNKLFTKHQFCTVGGANSKGSYLKRLFPGATQGSWLGRGAGNNRLFTNNIAQYSTIYINCTVLCYFDDLTVNGRAVRALPCRPASSDYLDNNPLMQN